MAPRITPEMLEEVIEDEYYHVVPGTTLTICVLTLKNGFLVTGESASASMENFDAETGMRLSRIRAKEKIWSLEGYLLKQRMQETKNGD